VQVALLHNQEQGALALIEFFGPLIDFLQTDQGGLTVFGIIFGFPVGSVLFGWYALIDMEIKDNRYMAAALERDREMQRRTKYW